jgi:2-iminoacetate synthase ThiH
MNFEGLLQLIRGAGKLPAERDSFYNIVRTFAATGEPDSTPART